jgi:hypothetical protein
LIAASTGTPRASSAVSLVRGHAAVLERDARARAVVPADRLADRPQRLAHREPGRVARHEQRHEAVRAGPRLHREQFRDGRVRDERQSPVHHPLLALLHREHIRSALGERAVVAPAVTGTGVAPRKSEVIVVIPDEFRQEALALLRRRQTVEQHVGQRGGLRQHRREVHVSGAQLFHDDAGGEAVGARAAGFFGQRQGA